MEEKMAWPTKNKLPETGIDWAEVSSFVEKMLAPDALCTKGWRLLDDPCATKDLQPNSAAVLHALQDDLYGFFYKQKAARYEVWQSMESFVRAKYSGLTEKALSRVLATYHRDDR